MSCCGHDFYIGDCFKIHSTEERFELDQKTFLEKAGIDLTPFKMHFHANSDYAIQWFPRQIGQKEHTLFQIACYSKRSGGVYVGNKGSNLIRKITEAQFDFYTDQWFVEAKIEEAIKEKDEWREKLKAIGINPQW